MHDYQLERLNTRSFEQLVQALGLEVIGNQLLIFGDGPDGGREATFEGPTKYPEGNAPWDGYGIVQAKFRQHPFAEAGKNADWVIEQLRGEFQNFAPRPPGTTGAFFGQRVCPEFYVFATNLALSPVLGSGGKDRVKALLDGYKTSHGLKDYAVWDGDQIRRFLDTCPAIRTTYAAWLLPGDVLTEMLKQLQFKRPDFASTIRRYLEVELLDDRYARLSQGGYTEANAIPLSQVFVDLPVEAAHRPGGVGAPPPGNSPQHRATFLALFLEEGRQVLRPSVGPPRAAGRVVLIGGPGQGKTTLGQFCCQLHRAALLKATGARFSDEVKQTLEWIEQQTQDLPAVHALRYPLRIDLKALAESLAGGGHTPATSVLDYLVKYIARRTDAELGKDDFRAWLKAYPWLLVLDGLDEVPASSNRAQVMEAVRIFVSMEAHHQDADLLVLATSRPQGYSDEFDRKWYQHLNLAPLNADEALRYGTRLAEARHPGSRSRFEQLTASLKRATQSDATVRLMESPLQVTIMLALIEGGGEPPEQRWKLFREYYDVIYRREKERNTPFSPLLKQCEPDLHWIHHRAGWVLQQRNAIARTTAARLTHAEFEALVDARLLKRGHKNAGERRELVERLRKAATDRLVFLVGNTAREIGFEVRSLQEFMAAEHVFDGSEACTQTTIKMIAPHAYWRNVFLFAAGRIFFEKESLVDSLIAVCDRLNEPLTDPALGAVAGGSRLAAAMLRDGLARNQPENARALARCAARLLDGSDPGAAPELAEFFWGDTADVWREELERRVRVSGGSFSPLRWRVCLDLLDIGVSLADELLRTYFPWRHSKASDFLFRAVDETGPIPDRFWELFQPHIYHHPPNILSEWEQPEWEWLEWEQPEWAAVRQFFHITTGEREWSHLLGEQGERTCNALTYVGGAIEKWADLKVPPEVARTGHPSWRLFHFVSEFARDYTPSGLANQLKRIHGEIPFDEVERWEFDLPWQLYLGLVVIHEGRPVPEVAAAVAAGALGRAEDWTRWDGMNFKGIWIADLAVHPDPLAVSDDHRGGMFENASWRHMGGYDPPYFEFAAALTRTLPRIHIGRTVAIGLVDVACVGLNAAPSDWSNERGTTVTEFVARCRELRIPMPRALVAAVLKSSLDPEEKCDLLATIGGELGNDSWLPDWKAQAFEVNEECVGVIEAAAGANRLAGVLVALSVLPPLPFATALPAGALESCRRGDERAQCAALALELNSLRWEKPAEAAVADALRVRARSPKHLSELLGYINSQGASGSHLEAFVLALTKLPEPDLDDAMREQCARLLVKLVERRPAVEALPDPWQPKSADAATA